MSSLAEKFLPSQKKLWSAELLTISSWTDYAYSTFQ